jgi:hypothetical protein
MSNEKVNLSQATEFELRGQVTIKVYPASLETYILLAPKLKEMDKMKDKNGDIEKQAEIFAEIVYALIKDDNQIKKEDLKKVLTLEACVRIMQKALGAFGTPVAAK